MEGKSFGQAQERISSVCRFFFTRLNDSDMFAAGIRPYAHAQLVRIRAGSDHQLCAGPDASAIPVCGRGVSILE